VKSNAIPLDANPYGIKNISTGGLYVAAGTCSLIEGIKQLGFTRDSDSSVSDKSAWTAGCQGLAVLAEVFEFRGSQHNDDLGMERFNSTFP
jgi:hypothetical protein